MGERNEIVDNLESVTTKIGILNYHDFVSDDVLVETSGDLLGLGFVPSPCASLTRTGSRS